MKPHPVPHGGARESASVNPAAAQPGSRAKGQPRSDERSHRAQPRRTLVAGARGLLAILAVGLALGATAWLALPLVPLPAALFEPAPVSLELLDRAGHPLRQTRADTGAYARAAVWDDLPRPLIEATLAAEDKRFWRHGGVDWRASLRAAWSLVRHRRVISGGSTITQQLIKLAEPRPRTLRTKILEAAQALRLEQVWSKERILTEYLNRLDYGNLNTGCAAAAAFYFAKPLRDLSLAQAALLAGLPQAPSRLNPHRHPDRALKRQRWILQRLEQNRQLTQAECQHAVSEPLRLASPRRTFEAPHFTEMLLREIERRETVAPGPSLNSSPGRRRGREADSVAAPGGPPPDVGGYGSGTGTGAGTSLRTSLDLPLNQFVERALRQSLDRLRPQHVRQGAVVVLDNRTGDVLALVGSEDFFAPEAGQVNGAWALRSPGSTLKPFTYLLAFEQGATPASVVDDLPVEFATSTGVFAPVNYDHRCYGPMRYRLALANSLNLSAVKVLASIGGPAVLLDRLRQCGLTTLDRPADAYGLGLTLGNAEVRLLELVNAYACLARLGEFRPLRFTAGSASRVPSFESVARTACDPGAAWLIADILSDNQARTLAFGAESHLRFAFPVACKTGTSSDFRDNWAVGYTPEFTVGVWVGNFEGTPMTRVSGVSGAAPILHAVFAHLHGRFGTSWYDPPANALTRLIHPVTGKLLTATAPGAVRETFLDGHLPPAESPEDTDAAGRICLPTTYRAWLASGDNWLGDRAVAAGQGARALRWVFPLPGTVFFLDPDLPEASRRIRLRVEGGSELAWRSDSLACRTERGEGWALMREGRHRLTARCQGTGEEVETWIEVKGL